MERRDFDFCVPTRTRISDFFSDNFPRLYSFFEVALGICSYLLLDPVVKFCNWSAGTVAYYCNYYFGFWPGAKKGD